MWMPSPRANSVAPAAAPRLRKSSSGASTLSSVTQFTACQLCGANADAVQLRASGSRGSPARAASRPLRAALHARHEAVEQPVLAILGHEHSAGARIDASGLVVEAAHRLQRHRIDLRGRRRRHLEHVAVLLVDVAVGFWTFSSQVSQLPHGVVPPAQLRIVPASERCWRSISSVRAFRRSWSCRRAAAPGCAPACRRPGRSRPAVLVGDQLVVADQRDPAAAEVEAAHTVGLVGHRAAIAHRIAEVESTSVGEPGGQVDQPVRIGNQRAVACRARRLCERGAHAAARRQRGERGAGGAKELAAVGDHAVLPGRRIAAPAMMLDLREQVCGQLWQTRERK
jgi:hypothetical protein